MRYAPGCCTAPCTLTVQEGKPTGNTAAGGHFLSPATFTALSKCELYALKAEDFNAVAQRHPEVQAQLAAAAARYRWGRQTGWAVLWKATAWACSAGSSPCVDTKECQLPWPPRTALLAPT